MMIEIDFHRRISPKELRDKGWTPQPKPAFGAGRDYHHRDGWIISHCGHPTANYPYMLTDPDGCDILTGAAVSGRRDYGTAWPTVAAAVDYVATVSRPNPTATAAPPIAGEADREYQPRLDAERCTLQFKDGLRPKRPQARADELPLFGGEPQGSLFE
jgi:hypothetical protein